MLTQQTETLKPIKLPPIPDEPLVSVLIPNYNYAAYIGKALESVLCQTYPHFEVIVCDDGSTDNSCEVVKTYIQKDSRIKLLRQENKRIAAALNTAYNASQGQIICLLDSDDVWMPNKLQKVVEVFKCNPKCGFFIHNLIDIDRQGNLIKSTPWFEVLASGWMAPFAMENGGWVNNIPPASALSFRREVTNLIFPLNPAMIRRTDSLIYRLAPLITVIESVPEALTKFRWHDNNSASTKTLTVKTIEQGQVAAKLVHQEQKNLLRKLYGEEIAQRLTPQEQNVVWCHECYLLAHFHKVSKTERRALHRQLITHPNFNMVFPLHKPARWLIQWDLPNPLFEALFKKLYQPNRLKEVVKSLLKIRSQPIFWQSLQKS